MNAISEEPPAPEPPAGGRRNWVVPIISVLIATGAIVVAVVVTMRRSQYGTTSDIITYIPEGRPPQHQVLLPKLDSRTVVVPDRPHNPGEVRHPGELEEKITRRRTFFVSTNSIGLRGPEVKVPSPKYRVMCAGDSITFGWGVDYEESWPVQLSKILDVDPVVAAWPNAHLVDLIDWIEKNAASLDTDLVLFSWGPVRGGAGLEEDIGRLEMMARDIAPIKIGWIIPPAGTFDPTAVYNAQKVYPKLPDMTSLPILNLTPVFRAELPLPGVIAEFDGPMVRMIRLPGNEVVLETRRPPPDPEFGEIIAPEILAAFEADKSIKEPLFFDDGHPDEEGFEVFARAVAEWVREQGWVK